MLKNLKTSHICTTILGTVCFSTLLAFQFPDNGLIAQIKTKLEKYQEYSRPDKVYIHTDRAVYTTGETIWLKAYQVNGGNHRPQLFSKVIYIELINSEKQVITRQKLKAEGGYGHGQFTLAGDLPSGTYLLRAYNNWMQNADADFFFTKPIQVLNINQTQQTNTLAHTTNTNFDLQFFPEGGNMIEGLTSRIAFKAVNATGKSMPVEGTILTTNGDTLSTFKSFHLGMGAFELQPLSGQKYTAAVRLTDSTTATFLLPQAMTRGTVMRVDHTSDQMIKVSVESNALQKGYILAQSRGTVYFSDQVDVNSKKTIDIPTAGIPDGILHITLFDENGNPQSERLSFVNHQQHLRIQVNTAKQIYQPREKVTFDISVTDKQGNPVSAHLSMAVTDAGLLQMKDIYENTIVSYLLLGSDLNGNIEQPGFYFSGDAKASQALDYLLMTQGWRRFAWKDILSSTFFPEQQFDMEDGLSVGGHLIHTTNSNPVPNQLVILSAPGAMPPFQQQYTDQAGKFYFSGLQFNDDKDLFLQVPSTLNNVPVRMAADTTYDLRFPEISMTAISDAAGKDEFIEKSRKQMKMESIYKQEEPDTTFIAAAGTGSTKSQYALVDVTADHTIELDKYNEFPDMTEVLREIVPGVLLQSKKGVVNGLRILDIERKLYFKGDPMYFIDGIPVYKAEDILTLDPGMVQTIEVYGRPNKLARFEQLGKNGVLAIHTRTHDYYPDQAQNLFRIPMRGYIQSREFYTPVYESNNSSRKPDFRQVAYWNPAVVTDANGKAVVSFYNPDNITAYQVEVEGMSGQGLPGVTRQSYQVKLPLQSGR